ncbi:hypothetical protein P262_03704 [Cronobacter malonaticus]|uniref:Uncharacterized protein n=1 Tax=Cronobacter malonaticus TaxID=413503 RepID=V5U0U5_9ENTR|nr:hypothetical protein P262_03704 [Cronobacter malonaticus]CCJ96148.1 hypothetical protein BN131_3821 [Cronobacter malonaticus 681]
MSNRSFPCARVIWQRAQGVTLIMILKRWVNYQKIRFFFCRKCQPYGYS